jgi:DNA-binding HxlR family transcriptional regulator
LSAVRWQQIGELDCSVARSLSVVGDRWTLMIVRDAFLGARRFEHWQASLGISPALLTDRLGKLSKHGILERRAYQRRPVRHEYRLTEKGLDLYPVIVAQIGWADRWLAGPAGPPLALTHKACGKTLIPVLESPRPRLISPV